MATGSIVQVVLSLAPGGTERLVIDICRELRGRMALSVCCLDEAGAWAGELREIGVEVVALGRQPGFAPALSRRIARFARAKGATVLHCHQYSPFVYGQLAALGSALRVVYTEHGRSSDAPPGRKQRLVNPLLGRLPDAICAVSENLKRFMVQSGFAGDRIQVVYNGIRVGTPVTPAARALARGRLALGESDFVLGTVARLDAVKDIPTLVRAFALLAPRLPSARLVVVGEGPGRAAIEAAIAAGGVASRVTMVGHSNDVGNLLPAFDVYVNSSVTEGVSLTILEAMAASLPVLATGVGGTPEVVVDGVTGRLFRPGDGDALARAAESMAASAADARGLGRAGRERVERMFQLRQMVDAYASLYAVE